MAPASKIPQTRRISPTLEILEGRITPSDLFGDGQSGEFPMGGPGLVMASSTLPAPTNLTFASYGEWTNPSLTGSQGGIYFTWPDGIDLSGCNWSLEENGKVIAVNSRYYTRGSVDKWETTLPALPFTKNPDSRAWPPITNPVILPLRLGSVANEYAVVVRDSSGQTVRTLPIYSGLQGEPKQTGSIALMDLDYSQADPTGVRMIRATQGEQVAALVLQPNQKYKIALGELGGSNGVRYNRDPVAAELVLSQNRYGVEAGLAKDVDSNLWYLNLDTSPLGGKAFTTAIGISNTMTGAATAPRYLGLVVLDTQGNPPAGTPYVGLGAVNTNQNNDQDFFRGTTGSPADTGGFKNFDHQYVYLQGGPNQVPLQAGKDSIAPSSTSAPLPDMVANESGGTGKRTPNSWRLANGGYDGKGLIQSLREAVKSGATPTVVLYNLMAGVYDDANGVRQKIDESGALALANLRNKDFMRQYLADYKFALDTIRGYAQGTTVSVIIEPDFLAYMMKAAYSPGANPPPSPPTIDLWAQPKDIDLGYDIGRLAEDVGLVPAGTVSGNSVVQFVQAMNAGTRYLSKQGGESVNLQFGWKFNLWATDFTMPDQSGWKKGISKVTDWFLANNQPFEKGQDFVRAVAKVTAQWYQAAGIMDMPSLGGAKVAGPDFIALDKYGIDGGNNQQALTSPGFTDPEATSWFFNGDHWDNYLEYAGQLHQSLGQIPVRLWQIPVGHVNGSTSVNPGTHALYPDLANKATSDTVQAWEDSAVSYFLGDTFSGNTAGGAAARPDFLKQNNANDAARTVDGQGNIVWQSHMAQAKSAGVEAILFGPGLPFATSAGGYNGVAAQDGYFWANKAYGYQFDNLVNSGKIPQGGENTGVPLDFGSPERNTVAGLYREILRREPDIRGLEHFTARWLSGTSFETIAAAILGSRENLEQDIGATYLDLLGREADPAGLENWVGKMTQGASLLEVRAGILSSPEYLEKVGGLDGFVPSLYQGLLLREADSEGLAHFNRVLSERGAYQAAWEFLNSREYLEREISRMYSTYLDRFVYSDISGLNHWLARLAQGETLTGVETDIAGSQESSGGPDAGRILLVGGQPT